MDQDARVTTREGRQGPSTTPFAASTTERESPRIRTRPGTRAAPKNPRNGRQSTTQKLPQHRSTPHRGKTAGAGTRDAQIAPQFHRQTTATTPQSEQNLPTKRTAPRHANRRRPNTKRQQTDTEATRPMTPTHGTNQPPRPRQAAPTSAGTRTRTPPRRTPAATEPKDRDTRRTGHETAERKQAQETTQQGDKAHTTTQPHNAHNKRQRTEARGGNKQRRQATQNHRATKSTKNTNMAKNRKTRAKQMVVGGKLLRGRKLQARKRPFEPDQRARRPKRRDEDDERRR